MAAPRHRILLIEDDEEDYLQVRELLAALEGEPFELSWIADGEQGLRMLLRDPPDACLVDFRVGLRTGLELVCEAAALGCRVPTILLTGAGSQQVDEAAMRAGVAFYLDKAEVTAERLERTIRYAINQHREHAACPPALGLGAAGDLDPPAEAAAGTIEPPRILLIEDDEDDYILTYELLSDVFGPSTRLEWVQKWDEAVQMVRSGRHDVYLIDYRLGERNGLELVREAVADGSAAPFIVLTGQGNREIDLEAMRAGAADYLVKGEITAPLLDRSIRYSIERHRAEKRLAELAQFDQLTGLANRFLFRDHLAKTLARADRSRCLAAVMLLDLDRFKVINDTHGHEAGDLLLKHIAARLKSAVRASDLIARLGGDEFTVVMDGITDPNLVAGFASRILELVKQPVSLGTGTVYTSASMGIAVYPTDGATIEELVASADAAMYRAKEQGSDRFHFYTMEMRVRAARRHELESGLRQALERQELELYYQPQLDLQSGRVFGLEALLRWRHPVRGVISPVEFVQLAEESGLIVPIGEWVLRTACRQLKAWHQEGLHELRLAVNFSARQLQHDDLRDLLTQVVKEHDLEPRCLEIEVTESDILDNPSRIQTLLAYFVEIGIQVSLDDFGTGYSSLNHLRSFRGATIKIDRSFIANLCCDASDAAIVQSLIQMAHSLQLRVIAEGVETLEQLALLRRYGCDAIQGYLISPPLAVRDIPPDLLRRPLFPPAALELPEVALAAADDPGPWLHRPRS